MKDAQALAFNAINVTQAAAIACLPWVGRGDGMAADCAAVDAMRIALNGLPISGRIVIGEGERDEAPMLYIGEELGLGGEAIDIAVDPLEGTNLCATAAPNALTVLAMAKRGNLLYAPDVYMQKIAVGAGLPDGIIDINASVKANLSAVAGAKNKDISDMLVVILERPRHAELIAQTREAGARVQLISDGDVSAIIEAAYGKVDMVIGSGGAPEGVLAAAALRCLGGQMQGRLLFDDEAQKERAKTMGVVDFSRIYQAHELAAGEVIFAATGVTNGALMRGVAQAGDKLTTHSICMDSASKTIHRIATNHLTISRK